MEIIICDDNLSERSLMIDYILKWASEKYLEIQINTCKDWMELAAALEGWLVTGAVLDPGRRERPGYRSQCTAALQEAYLDFRPGFRSTGLQNVCELLLHEAGQLPENAAGSGVCSERAEHNVISGGM